MFDDRSCPRVRQDRQPIGDRVNARPSETVEATHDLLLELAQRPEQLNAPVIYTNARSGTATADLRYPGATLEPLLEALLDSIPAPVADTERPLQLMVSNIDHDPYSGRLAIGRIARKKRRDGAEIVRVVRREPANPRKPADVDRDAHRRLG